MNPLSWLRRIRRFDAFVGRDPLSPRGSIPREVRPLGPGEGILLGTITIDVKTGRILDEKRVGDEKTSPLKST